MSLEITNNLNNLPVELDLEVLSYLRVDDLLNLRLVCKALDKKVKDHIFDLWEKLKKNPTPLPEDSILLSAYLVVISNPIDSSCIRLFTKFIAKTQEKHDYVVFADLPVTMNYFAALQRRKIDTNHAICKIWKDIEWQVDHNLPEAPAAYQILDWAKKPESQEKLKEIKWLCLNNRGIRMLPGHLIGLFTNLVKIELDGNQLSSLPKELSQIPSLRHILLRYNKFTEFPLDLIGRAINFENKPFENNNDVIIALAGNSISAIPEEIKYITNNMTFIELHDNPIHTISSTIKLSKYLNAHQHDFLYTESGVRITLDKQE